MPNTLVEVKKTKKTKAGGNGKTMYFSLLPKLRITFSKCHYIGALLSQGICSILFIHMSFNANALLKISIMMMIIMANAFCSAPLLFCAKNRVSFPP